MELRYHAKKRFSGVAGKFRGKLVKFEVAKVNNAAKGGARPMRSL